MRVVYCSCGERLEATDNQKLFRRYRHHVDVTHIGSCLADEQIHAVITANSYDGIVKPINNGHSKEYGAS
jgi:hypothetical protein